MWNKKWVVGNWKMNGRLHENDTLLSEILALPPQPNVCIGIAPPAVYLQQVRNATQNAPHNTILPCVQDLSRFPGTGAYTGEISAAMLKDAGAQAVLVGHSDRSLYFNETNDERRQKIENALAAGLIPLLCVGENLQERENGDEKTTVARQLSVLKGLQTDTFAIAYEPVWAIGTGKVANKEQIAQMHHFIYNEVLSFGNSGANIRILYGGSVNETNAAEIFSAAHVDGALVGGASLSGKQFSAIIRAAEQA